MPSSILLPLSFSPCLRPDSCLALNRNGLIQTYHNDTCDESRPALCEYRPCYTVRGKQCQFPFKYKNYTLNGVPSDIEYNSCSSLDIFEPWCPTGELRTTKQRRIDACLLRK